MKKEEDEEEEKKLSVNQLFELAFETSLKFEILERIKD